MPSWIWRYQAILIAIVIGIVVGIAVVLSLTTWELPGVRALLTSTPPSTTQTDSTSNETPDQLQSVQQQLTELQRQFTNLEAELAALQASVAAEPSPTIVRQTVAPTQTSTAFQKQVLYLGSAETFNQGWTDTPVEITLNTADYPTGTEMKFEAGLAIVNGEAWARLKNVTTGAIINTTEVFHNGNTVTWKSAPLVELHNGNNTYRVQLRSTSGERARMDGARLILE